MKSKNTGHKDRFGSNFLIKSFTEQPPVSIQIHTLNGRLIDANPDYAKLHSTRDEALKDFMINTTFWEMKNW